jgi:hypothetical protein
MLPLLSIGPAERTERISFVSPGSAFALKSWRPNETAVKDQTSGSAMVDYDRLVDYRYKMTEETMVVVVSGTCSDDVADRLNELRSTIKAARDYWVDKFNNEPIYLEVKSSAETQTRYALIDSGRVPTDPPPFEAPFYSDSPTAMDITVIMRRGPWMNLAPQTASDVLLSAVETFDGRDLGNVDSSGVREPVPYQYVANKHNVANLTHIFVEDSVGAFSPNRMDAALPYSLLPAVPAPGDRIYFGIETGAGSIHLLDSGPFCSLVFDIGTAATAASLGITWDYYTGLVPPWDDLMVNGHLQDNTDADGAMTGVSFDTTGVNSIHWEQPSDWVPTIINGITAYWVRARVNMTSGAIPVPTQQNRDIYTITWAYAEVQADEIGGNLPAMLRHTAEGMSARRVWDAQDLQAHELWVGLRDVERGEDFAAYLNATHEQNPPGVIGGVPDVRTAVTASMSAASGEMIDYTMALVTEERVFQYYFDYTIWPQYYGTYQVFLRGMQTAGNIGAVRLRIGAQILGESAMFYSSWAEFKAVGHDHQVLSLGRLQIPNGPLTADDTAEGIIRIYADVINNAGTPHVYIYDLVLIPVDEWVGYFTAKDLDNPWHNFIGYLHYLDIDSIMNPEVPVRALLVNEDGGAFGGIEAVEEAYRADINTTYPFLTPTNRQRLWFLARKTQGIGAPTNKRSEPEFATLVKEYAVQVYNTMRGTG